ncbi:complex I assembly factor ACAD9, mitochondrial-like isoform X1 [Styela clava]
MYPSSSTIRLLSTFRKSSSIIACADVSQHPCCAHTCAKRKILLKQHGCRTNFKRKISVFEVEKKETLKSFAKEIYNAKISMNWVFPYPTLEGSKELNEFHENLKPINDFLSTYEINSKKLDEDAEIPKELVEKLKKLGLFGMLIPEEYDGKGLSNMKFLKISEDLASADASVNMMVASHNLLGAQPILMFGNEDQKKKYLPKMASGETIAAFCCNEASCGSDINTMQTRATLSDDGQFWLLSGEKTSINNADIADVFIVFAKTEVVDVGGEIKDIIAAFIVEQNFGRIHIGPQEDKMGMRALNTSDIIFDQTPVPVGNMIGEVRDGFKIATDTLNYARLGLVAGMIGPMRDAVQFSLAFNSQRKQFGRRLEDFELAKERIFRMNSNIYLMESVAYLTMGKYDQAVEEDKIPDLSVESAISKVFCAQKAQEIANDYVELFGYRGYTRNFPCERLFRDSKMLSLSEGTEDVLKLYIALCGLQNAEGYLDKRLRNRKIGTVRQQISSLFDEFRDHRSNDHIKKGFGQKKIPSFGLTTDSKTKTWLDPRLKECALTIERLLLSFYRKVYRNIEYFGNGINEEQIRLRKLAEITIALYSLLATMSRCNKTLILGLRRSDTEYRTMVAHLHVAYREVGHLLEELEKNFGSPTNDLRRICKDLIDERRYFIAHPLELEHRYLENPIYLQHFVNVKSLSE